MTLSGRGDKDVAQVQRILESCSISLETRLRERRDAGRKLLVPYVTAGVRGDWLDLVRAFAVAGADAIEIGLPFSDPVMDGPVIQEASVQALRRGTTPAAALNELAATEFDVPLAVMTYYNLVFRFGHERFASALVDARVSGCILPDLSMEESGPSRERRRCPCHRVGRSGSAQQPR